MSTNTPEQDDVSEGRRELLKALAAASGAIATRVLLPAVWSTPIVASMTLPAHAAMSNPSSQSTNPPAGSTTLMGSGPNGVAISPAPAPGKVTLTITPPTSVITARNQFQVCERFDDTKATPPTKFVRVVALMTPSGDATVSASYTLELNRPAGDYEYQLRWNGGDTAWVKVTIRSV